MKKKWEHFKVVRHLFRVAGENHMSLAGGMAVLGLLKKMPPFPLYRPRPGGRVWYPRGIDGRGRGMRGVIQDAGTVLCQGGLNPVERKLIVGGKNP